jgi:phosphatidylinositol-3-phosphatase
MSWFRSVVSWLLGLRPAPLPRRIVRPALEGLEDRWVPSRIPAFDHVVVVVEENHAFQQVIGSPDAPYINSLARDPKGALFTQSFGITHPSQPNYLYLFSGSNQGVLDNATPATTFTAPNLAAALLKKGLKFTGYSESLPFAGFTGTSDGAYFRKHSPWVNWQGTGRNTLSIKVNQPFSAFPTNFKKLPTVSFVIPNQLNDMHDGTVAAADTWLRQNLDSYVRWAKKHNSLLILTTDEDDYGGNNQIATLFIGAKVKHGEYGERIDHLNVLRTLEDMFHLPRLGNSATAAPIRDVWAR